MIATIIAIAEVPLAGLGAVVAVSVIVDKITAYRSRRHWRGRHRGPTVIAVGEPRLRLPTKDERPRKR